MTKKAVTFTPKYLDKILANPDVILEGKAQKDIFDAGQQNLGIRVNSGGTLTWCFFYTGPVTGKPARLKMGIYPALCIHDARNLARAHLDVLKGGRDPRVGSSENMSMVDLIKLRLEAIKPKFDAKGRMINEGLRSRDDKARMYKKDVIPFVEHVLVKDFRIHPHFNAIFDNKRSTPRMAGLVGVELKKLFNFAEGKGIVEHSPIAKVQFDIGLRIKEHSLTMDQMKEVWTMLPYVFENVKLQRIIKLLILTGCRVSEVCEAHRDEFDLANRLWTIPAARVKNGKKHGDFDVPLSDAALAIFRDAMRDTNNPDWVFPDESGKKPINGKVVDRSLARAHATSDVHPKGRFDMAKWTPHDLRRTLITTMLSDEDHGFGVITKFDVALVVNHKSVTKVDVTDIHYNKNKYLAKKREVLDKWAAFIERVVGINQLKKAA